MPTVNAITPANVSDQTHERQGGSDDVLKQWLVLAVTGQRTASGTVRKFVDTVDKVAPLDSFVLAPQREVIAAALEMTQRLVHTPYGVGRSLVQSAVLVNVEVDVDVASQTQPPPT